MGFGQKYIATRMDLDVHESLVGPSVARYIKNLIFSLEDTSAEAVGQGAQTGVYKPLRSNAVYVDNFKLPAGDNHPIGGFTCKELNQAVFFIYNSNRNHAFYRINGADQTIDTIYIGPTLNFQLNPENFIHKGGCAIEIIYVTDPATNLKRVRTFYFFTDDFNDQRCICAEDSIATKGFNPTLFSYFAGNYDPKILINMGVPSSNDPIVITPVPVTNTSQNLPNKMLFNTWQFRTRGYDVWGRPSEYGIISDEYYIGSDCLSSSSGAPRCVTLSFPAPPPHINQVEIAYRNCNSAQWSKADTLDLYSGSPLGDWWLRSRNEAITFDPVANTITYQFCADRECDPIAQTDTSRLENPLPITSVAVSKINENIALINNKEGFNPFSISLKNQIKFTVEPPSGQSSDVNRFRNISILVEIFNPVLGANGCIFFLNGQYYFQSPPTNTPFQFQAENYGQFFKNKTQSGFIGYFAGSNVYTISEQYSLDSNGVFEKITDFSSPSFVVTKRYFQKFTFSNVQAGVKVFRIAGLTVDPSTDSPAVMFKTSTNVGGIFSFTPSSKVINRELLSNSKELIIDVCENDYDSVKDNKILSIYDFTDLSWALRQGYVYNTNNASTDQIGIELLRVSSPGVNSLFTDHNGYFFVSFIAGGNVGHGWTYSIFGYCNCKIIPYVNNFHSGVEAVVSVNNWFANQLTNCTDYPTQKCAFVLVKGRVLLCGDNIGVPGIGIVLSRGRSAVTDADGNFTIIAHDDIVNGTRNDTIYFSGAVCSFTDCNGNCIGSLSVIIVPCNGSCQPREVDVSTTLIQNISQRGLLSEGVYPIGVGKWDWLKRTGFIEDLGYLEMPSVQETHLFAPSRIRVDIDSNAIFPDNITELTFWIGQETTIADYITWIVDSFLFVDNTGLENTEAPTQIKIFYASLVEYNKQNNFNTTVNWNFLIANAANTSSSPFTTDKVRFLLNGDGTFFPKAITALVKYDSVGQFFLINYTSDLAGLLPNAIIRLVRPKQCTGEEPYNEIAFKVPIVNGKATISKFYLNAFDTYYIFRQIPVPTAQAIVPPATTPTFIDETRILGVPFEHNSPSDFWGQGCANFGRQNVKNEQETQLHLINQIALSGALSPTNQLNFLCFFDDAQKFTFSDNPTNGFIAVIVQGVTLLIIGQSDHFVVGFNDNIVRVDGSGQVIVPSAQDKFGQPQRKLTPKYGCLLFDKNTIYEKDGIVHWMDTAKGFFIQHNFEYGQQVSMTDLKRGIPGGIDSWLKPKIKEIQNFNLVNGNTRYWHVGVNGQGSEVILSDFTIGNINPINNLRQVDVTVNETIAMGIFSKMWKSFYGFISPMYIELEGELSGKQLFSFFKAIPYSHYNELDEQEYGTMYGQPLVRVLEPVISIDSLRNKKPLSIAVFCKESQYFSDRVISSTGQMTRMLLAAWIQASFGWYAPFLCDLNTPPDPNRPIATGPNALTDGDTIIGTYIKVRLIGGPSSDEIYSEMQGVAISLFPDVTNLDNKTE